MNRTFLITGATKGIGFAIAEHLSGLGYDVIGIARNLAKAPFPGTLYLADLSQKDACEAIFRQIEYNHQVDGIINNVGIAIPQKIEDISLSDFHRVLDINLRPALQAMQIFVSKMKARNWGRVVNLSSRAMLGKSGRSSYSAAKAALIGFTRTWALELIQAGITVNAVAPGPVNTEQFFLNHPKGSKEEKSVLAIIPAGRIGTPDEIAYAVAFFLHDKASFITGQTLFADGGASIGAMPF